MSLSQNIVLRKNFSTCQLAKGPKGRFRLKMDKNLNIFVKYSIVAATVNFILNGTLTLLFKYSSSTNRIGHELHKVNIDEQYGDTIKE